MLEDRDAILDSVQQSERGSLKARHRAVGNNSTANIIPSKTPRESLIVGVFDPGNKCSTSLRENRKGKSVAVLILNRYIPWNNNNSSPLNLAHKLV